MADLTPQLRTLVDNVRALASAYEKQKESLLDLIECCYWEVKNSRPFNYTGLPRENAERDRRREALLDALKKLLASAGRDLSGLRRARDPASNTGD